MVELRARQLVKLGAVLDRLFPELRAAFGKLGSASALAILSWWPTLAHLSDADPAEVAAVLARASRGSLGAAKAAELQARAVGSAGVRDPPRCPGVAASEQRRHRCPRRLQRRDLLAAARSATQPAVARGAR